MSPDRHLSFAFSRSNASDSDRVARILIVDGDAQLRAALTAALTQDGHEVEVASSGASGIALARASSPSIVILEYVLPDMNGADLCRQLHEVASVRPLLLVLTTALSEEDRVAAFEAGCDDYVTKPHSMRELLLRVRAIGRRRSGAPPPERITLAQMTIDRAARRVDVAGRPVELTRREFDCLVHLAERAGRVQTREILVADVWGELTDSARVVDTTIKRIRRKLGPEAPEIKTIRGVGYKLELA